MSIKKVISQLIETIQHKSSTSNNELSKQQEKQKENMEMKLLNVENLQVLGELSKLEELPRQDFKNMNISMQSNSTPEGYVEWGDTQNDFFVTVSIPQGYQLASREDYALEITIDESLLKLFTAPTVRKCTIYVEDESGDVANLNTTTNVNKMKLQGILSYNVLLQGFEAVEIDGKNQLTQINQNGTQIIDQVLGFTSVNYSVEDNPFRDYSITLLTNNEIMVILPLTTYTVQEGSEEFFRVIEDSSKQRILGKKYSLIISPSPEPVS